MTTVVVICITITLNVLILVVNVQLDNYLEHKRSKR